MAENRPFKPNQSRTFLKHLEKANVQPRGRVHGDLKVECNWRPRPGLLLDAGRHVHFGLQHQRSVARKLLDAAKKEEKKTKHKHNTMENVNKNHQ